MTTPRDHDFDSRLRQVHDEALQHLSVRTRAQLVLRQSVATSRRSKPSRRPAWVLASACAVGALALGLIWHLRQPASPAADPAVGSGDVAVTAPASHNDFDDAYAVFDESPDLYVWLASDEATAVLE
jgi:hypothetical protein